MFKTYRRLTTPFKQLGVTPKHFGGDRCRCAGPTFLSCQLVRGPHFPKRPAGQPVRGPHFPELPAVFKSEYEAEIYREGLSIPGGREIPENNIIMKKIVCFSDRGCADDWAVSR